MVRRLAAIMFTDMVGSTELAHRDEKAALNLLKAQAELAGPVLAAHHGRLVKSTGDGMLVEFGNALAAIQCAVEFQRLLHDRDGGHGQESLRLRIGLHIGDVEEQGTDILGDAVNIAARVEPLAEPGGVALSEPVYVQVRNKVPFTLELVGTRSLKGVSEPVAIYRVRLPWAETLVSSGPPSASRLAVLPFASMSSDPENEYFADGMTEELIDRLAQVKGLEVIARTSVMTYKKKEKKVSDIARELFVGSIVEGSVRKAGNRVRVTAQLIKGETEGHVWSSHYDGSLDDIFAVQSEIAEKVAGELKARLLESERRTLESKPTENLEAYGDFLHARELYYQSSVQSRRHALMLFEKAVRLDPSFARAHVGVAQCHQSLATGGYEPWDAMLPVVRASLGRALELDPNLAEAHAALAVLRLNEDDVRGAEAEATKATELNPNLPVPHQMLREVAGLKGDPEEVVRQAEIAYRLDPNAPDQIFGLGLAYLFAGREQQAVEHCRRTEHLAPTATYQNMATYYLAKGEWANAREMHAKFQALRPASPWVVYMGGVIDALAGDKERALQAIRTIEEAKMGPVAFNYLAYVYHALGDLDQYFANLSRALEGHTLNAYVVRSSPLLARAREDPRFEELLEKLRRQTGLAG